MLDLAHLTETKKQLLADRCEDFLLHRNIPLHSYTLDDIILQAVREGFQLSKFEQ